MKTIIDRSTGGSYTAKELAAKYNVGLGAIYGIINLENWVN